VKKSNIIVAFFWIALGTLVCYGATRLGLGTVTEPGSGFIFFWLGLILAMLSVADLAASLRGSEGIVQEMKEMNWVKIARVLLFLLLYAFLLERLGFVLTTFLLLSFLLGWIEQASWTRSLGVAAVAALGSFAVFELWLKIRLPKGILGF
jgi:putative tricarboxylic transport membrane protein